MTSRNTAEVSRAPGRPRSEQVERAIVEATLDLLARHGVSGASIEAVASEAGVAKTTIYRRWPSKDELILDALARLKGPIPLPPGASVRDDVIFLLTATCRNATETRNGLILPKLIGEARDHPALLGEYFRRIVTPRRKVFQEVLRRGIAEGLLRPDVDLELAAEAFVAPVLNRCMVHPEPALSDGQIAELVDLLLDGLRRR
jgi:AcrR family transcriptional regulator